MEREDYQKRLLLSQNQVSHVSDQVRLAERRIEELESRNSLLADQAAHLARRSKEIQDEARATIESMRVAGVESERALFEAAQSNEDLVR